MSVTIMIFILAILSVLLIGVLFTIFMKITHFNVFAIVVGLILLFIGSGVVAMFWFNLEDKFKEDYRECETVATYDIYDISYDGDNTIIHYIDQNKELRHIKSSNVRVFYDLADDREPYMNKVEYWRLCFYWNELELHIKE